MGRACNQQSRLGVTSQRLSKDERQLTVTIRNVTRLLRESHNAVTEGGERLVDLLGLFKGLSRSTGLSDLLTSCQVRQVELSDLRGAIR